MSTEAETDHRGRERKTASHDGVSTVTAESRRSERVSFRKKQAEGFRGMSDGS